MHVRRRAGAGCVPVCLRQDRGHGAVRPLRRDRRGAGPEPRRPPPGAGGHPRRVHVRVAEAGPHTLAIRRGSGTAVAGQRSRLFAASLFIRAMAPGSSSPGRAMTDPSAIMRFMISRPRSVRTMVSVQSLSLPMPPVEMSACSAAKSGQWVQPSRVQAWHSLSGISWYRPSRVQIWNTPLMFILTISSMGSPYLVRNSSSKIESSNVLEHSSPMLNRIGLPTLPALRLHMIGGTDDWHDIPTRARRVWPRSRASLMASVLAEYV